jgi:hypothetical protein
METVNESQRDCLATVQLGLETCQFASFHMRLKDASVPLALPTLSGKLSLAKVSASPSSEQTAIHTRYSPGINIKRGIVASTLTRPGRENSEGSL